MRSSLSLRGLKSLVRWLQRLFLLPFYLPRHNIIHMFVFRYDVILIKKHYKNVIRIKVLKKRKKGWFWYGKWRMVRYQLVFQFTFFIFKRWMGLGIQSGGIHFSSWSCHIFLWISSNRRTLVWCWEVARVELLFEVLDRWYCLFS